ncbi:DNA repair protein Rad1 [Penicillium taxi]|uniref:DNA repair protein Rad1 n=1 Tax=Penicillium taxi TaxID=168475 RepID=UPI0025458CBD|nr:DNA repair protein Rad1 [Penicillium taxi]KAJ5899002.1 DNA repair protein Rad1 [Penicillium taxi]
MSLNQVWEAASASPFQPLISKDSQFPIGFTLLLAAGRSFLSLASLGVPASLLFGFGSVLMICAVGVYV